MKCPMCGGIGLTDLHTPNVGRCTKCNGSGEIEATNEEWLHSLNTEQLADVIADFYLLGYTHGHNKMDITSRTKWSEWLKQPHNSPK